ncbi:MAG: potassium channel family protein [Gordonia sp. (in: high G+C Gram-positive bacteria)]
MTTVGYGDRFPSTLTGRLVAVALMIGGVALLGVVTGMFASWLMETIEETNESAQAPTQAAVADLVAELRALRAEVAALRGTEPAEVLDDAPH